jgi:ATP-dependent protease Clp ATPase subunit
MRREIKKRLTKPQKIKKYLEQLEIGQSVDKRWITCDIYDEEYNYFTSRSFDVHFYKARKLLIGKTFKCIKGNIVRIS